MQVEREITIGKGMCDSDITRLISSMQTSPPGWEGMEITESSRILMGERVYRVNKKLSLKVVHSVQKYHNKRLIL